MHLPLKNLLERLSPIRARRVSSALAAQRAVLYPSAEIMDLADAATLVAAPDDGSGTCEHDLDVTLDPELVPAWLRSATLAQVSLPEIPGVPQAFRVDGYVDWFQLLTDHRDALEVLEFATPTTRCLSIVEELRCQGIYAAVVAQVYIMRRNHHGELVFGLDVGAIYLLGTNDSALTPYLGELEDWARVRRPDRHGQTPMLVPDSRTPAIEFV